MAGKTSYSVILSSRAQKEIAASWEWYEERLPGLGDKFSDKVISRLNDIGKDPDRYPTRYKYYKEVSIDTFPFLVIYRINGRKNSVRVLSVFHTSQNPKKKYR